MSLIRKLLSLVCLLALGLPSWAQGVKAPYTPAQIQAARDFAVEGIKIAMTLDQVKALGHEVYKLGDSNEAEGSTSYVIAGMSHVDSLTIRIFNGNIYDMAVDYHASTVEKMGGWDSLYALLAQKIGPARDKAYSDPMSTAQKLPAPRRVATLTAARG